MGWNIKGKFVMDWMTIDNIKRLETLEQYEFVCVRVDELLREASAKGMLESEYGNAIAA